MRAGHCDILAKLLHPTLPKLSNTVTCAREQDFGLQSPWFGKMLVAFAPSGRERLRRTPGKKNSSSTHTGGGASRLAPTTEASSRTRLRGFARQP
jgi:hypothetical protein